MTEPLDKKLETWLRKQGYPLEMEAASIARKCGFEVSQSDYYVDPDEDQPREIDLVLSVQRYQEHFSCDYKLFIECKSSRDKPWLLFSTQNEFAGEEAPQDPLKGLSLLQSFVANDFGSDLLRKSYLEGNLGNIFPRLTTQPVIGYGVTQAFSDNTETPFKALMSSTKAALSYAKRFGSISLTRPFVFAAPVVVIDVPLFSVTFSEKTSDIELEEIKRGWLHWKHVVGGRSGLGVYIVHKSELSAFLKECFDSASWWNNVESALLQEILKKKYPDATL